MISGQCKLLPRVNDIHIYIFFGLPKILTRQGPSNNKSIRYGLIARFKIKMVKAH